MQSKQLNNVGKQQNSCHSHKFTNNIERARHNQKSVQEIAYHSSVAKISFSNRKMFLKTNEFPQKT